MAQSIPSKQFREPVDRRALRRLLKYSEDFDLSQHEQDRIHEMLRVLKGKGCIFTDYQFAADGTLNATNDASLHHLSDATLATLCSDRYIFFELSGVRPSILLTNLRRAEVDPQAYENLATYARRTGPDSQTTMLRELCEANQLDNSESGTAVRAVK